MREQRGSRQRLLCCVTSGVRTAIHRVLEFRKGQSRETCLWPETCTSQGCRALPTRSVGATLLEGLGVEQTIANYTLLRLLGRGGMGSVYEARQTALERRVAIKVLHKEFCEDTEVLKRFINEARVVNIIGHPGLVGVSEFGQTSEGAPFIVMEYVEGVTLREWIQRQAGRIPIEKVVRLSRQLASTLAAAHAKQIVHRDLKPV